VAVPVGHVLGLEPGHHLGEVAGDQGGRLGQVEVTWWCAHPTDVPDVSGILGVGVWAPIEPLPPATMLPVGTQKPRGRRRQMARRLKTLRMRARMSLEEAAERMEWSTSKLSRWETGEQLTEPHALKSLLDIYGVTADRWPEFLELSKLSRERGWWRAYGLDNRCYVALEADASLVKDFTFAFVPGLLQTADYARALFQASVNRRSAEQLRPLVAVRMIRQRRLTDPEDPLRLDAIVEESVLYRPVGGSAVLEAQLAHLVEAAALETVNLQILPTKVGAHPSMASGFTLLSFGDLGEPDMLYVEHAMGATHSEKEAEVAKATLKFDRLRSEGLSPDDSVALIRQVAERL
jgi:transcriptional regulator with XRE-family HTH domain